MVGERVVEVPVTRMVRLQRHRSKPKPKKHEKIRYVREKQNLWKQIIRV
jgi:hypothetical protein